jgi:DNA-binding MarR family transcriptional regulator
MRDRDRTIAQILECNRGLFRAMQRDMPRALVEGNLTMPQLKTLLALYGNQRATMGELADTLGVGVSTLTGIVDRLVEHGLVAREMDPHDRRVVVGRLTPAGAAVVDQLFLCARDRLGRVLGQLSDTELEMVDEAYRLLARAVERLSPAGEPLEPGVSQKS